jgi:hypothetical protein
MPGHHTLYTFSPEFFQGKARHPLCEFVRAVVAVTTINPAELTVVYLDKVAQVPLEVAEADKPCLVIDTLAKPTMLTRVALRTWFELQVRTDQASMETYDQLCKDFEAAESALLQADTDRVEALITTSLA